MPRALTKAQLVERNRQLERENGALTVALRYMTLRDTPDIDERTRVGDWGYRARAYGLDRADGGVLVIEFRCTGQRTSVHAYYADTWSSSTLRTPYTLDESAAFFRGIANKVRANYHAQFEAARP